MHTRARAYRVLLWLYPPGFRREYGESLVQLFNDQLRRNTTRRVWFRITRDLTISVPYEYWETFMATNNVTRAAITTAFTGVAVLAAILLGATIIGLLLMFLLAWQLFSILKMRGHGLSSVKWWHFVLGGVGVFATIFVVFALPWPESWRSQVPGDLAFYVVMAGISLSIVLLAVGLLTGVAQLANRRGRSPAA